MSPQTLTSYSRSASLGTRKRDKYHQELILFLRPFVLTNDAAVDNVEPLRTLEKLPSRDEIKEQLDPSFVAPPKSVIDRILPAQV